MPMSRFSRSGNAFAAAAIVVCITGITIVTGCGGDDDGVGPRDQDTPGTMLRVPDSWAGTWQTRSTPDSERGRLDVDISPLCAGSDVVDAFGLDAFGTLGALECDGEWTDDVADFTCTGPISLGTCVATLTLDVGLAISGDAISGSTTLTFDFDAACKLPDSSETTLIDGHRIDLDAVGCDVGGVGFGGAPAELGGLWTVTWTPTASCEDLTPAGEPMVWTDQLVCPGDDIQDAFGATGGGVDDALGGFGVAGDTVIGEAFWSTTDETGACTVITTFELTLTGAVLGGSLTGTLVRSVRTIGGDGGCVDEVICSVSLVAAERTSTDVSTCSSDGDPGDDILATLTLPAEWDGRWSVTTTLTDCITDDVLFSGGFTENWCEGARLTDVFFPTVVQSGFDWECREVVMTGDQIQFRCNGTRGAETTCVEVQSLSLIILRTGETTFTGAAGYASASTFDCGIDAVCLERTLEGSFAGTPICPSGPQNSIDVPKSQLRPGIR